MPDEIATPAHLVLVVGPFVALALVPLVSWLWRRVLGVPEGGDAGLAVGVGAWSLAMALATAGIGQWVLQMRSGVEVQGTLLGFVAHSTTVPGSGGRSVGLDGGRKVTTAAPQVAFVTADGRREVVTLLGGSLSHLEAGDRVTLRHDPADPASATAVDFQNERGALGFFALLTAIGLLSSIFFAWSALDDLQRARAAAPAKPGRAGPAAQRPPSRLHLWRDGPGQRWRAPLQRAGLASLVLALVGPFVLALPEQANMPRVFATALAGVAMALAWFGLRAALQRDANFALVLYGRCIGVAGFGLFAAWLWALGSE